MLASILCFTGAITIARGLATLSRRAMSRAYAEVEPTYLVPLDILRLATAATLGLIVMVEAPDHWVWNGGAVIFAASVHAMRRREPVLE